MKEIKSYRCGYCGYIGPKDHKNCPACGRDEMGNRPAVWKSHWQKVDDVLALIDEENE